MKKKTFINIGIIIFIIICIGILTNYVDSGRVATGHEPKCCIKIISNDGSKITYWGLGYKVIRYVGISPNEPYENNIGAKMGSWFMKYDLPIDSEYNKNKNIIINSLDDFYNTELTKYKDIRSLTKEYSLFDAQKDNCFVIGAMVHNDNLYNEFMNKYNNKESAFIRIAQSTVEGDVFLIDILYDGRQDEIYLVKDNTRDKFLIEKDRIITLKNYDKIGVWNYQNTEYWVAYNGELPDGVEAEYMLNSDELFIIATIN